MGNYEHVRSSSPAVDRRSSNDEAERLLEHEDDRDQHEDQDRGAKEKPQTLDEEQRERLLSEASGRDPQADIEGIQSRHVPRRRRWQRLGLFGLAGVLVAVAVALFLRQRHLQRLEDEVVRHFRRPQSDYVVNPAWNYTAPRTVREHNWTVSDVTANPDGVFRPMVVINGKFPGPMIVANEGDVVVVNVVNRARNATAIHWHGLFQNGTNWNDGTVGVTQCPIAPGESFRYEFNVSGQAGSYFYHGHQAAQGQDGLFGPIVILSAEEKDNQPVTYDTDRVVMVQDWYHDASDGLLRATLSPGSESSPTPDGALINGANKVDCAQHEGRRCDSSTAAVPALDVEPGRRHRLRIINVGALAWFEVSVDRHRRLRVTEVDGVTVQPVEDPSVLVGPGQRYSVILDADQRDRAGLYWLRARMVTHCFSENVLPGKGGATAQAIVRYNDTSGGSSSNNQWLGWAVLPKTEADSGNFAVECKDPPPGTYRPVPARRAPEYAHHSWHVRVNLEIGDWRLERGFLNGSTLRPNLRSPTLHRLVDGLAAGDRSFEAEGINGGEAFDAKHELVVSPGGGVETVDVVLQNFDEGSHPFHLHGTQMFVLAAGHGYFPGYEALGLKAEGKGLLNASDDAVVSNPTRRDVTTLEGFGWTLIRFVADNPGVWLFHCHMVWHAEAGMGMQFASRLDVVRDWTVPGQNARLCAAPPGELEKGATPSDDIWFGHFD